MHNISSSMSVFSLKICYQGCVHTQLFPISHCISGCLSVALTVHPPKRKITCLNAQRGPQDCTGDKIWVIFEKFRNFPFQ